MNGLLSASVAPAKPLVVENIPLIGGEYDGTRVTLKNCAPTITYGSKEDPSIPINYRRLDLDDGMGTKPCFTSTVICLTCKPSLYW